MGLKALSKAKEESATDGVTYKVPKSVKTMLQDLVAEYGSRAVAQWFRANFSELVQKEHRKIKKPA
jgi:hypothetical protein